MRIKYFLIVSLGLFISHSGAQNFFEDAIVYKDADVIFIKNKKLAGNNLLPNGKTKFDYVGIVFIEDGKPVIYHATEPVSKSSLEDFMSLSEDGHFKVKRLFDKTLLTEQAIQTMHTFAKAKLNSHYDSRLTLTSDEVYNAEFIYKIYQSSIGLALASPKTFADYKNDPLSIEFLKEAYGENIMNEKLIVVGDIYHSEFME
ncbi:MAG: YiiX/YebB-like N1pC/P60 family cysteine hydrolase [Bacteroidia bacterium]